MRRRVKRPPSPEPSNQHTITDCVLKLCDGTLSVSEISSILNLTYRRTNDIVKRQHKRYGVPRHQLVRPFVRPPSIQTEVERLNVVYGCSATEIAKILECSRDSVQGRLRRMRKREAAKLAAE